MKTILMGIILIALIVSINLIAYWMHNQYKVDEHVFLLDFIIICILQDRLEKN